MNSYQAYLDAFQRGNYVFGEEAVLAGALAALVFLGGVFPKQQGLVLILLLALPLVDLPHKLLVLAWGGIIFIARQFTIGEER